MQSLWGVKVTPLLDCSCPGQQLPGSPPWLGCCHPRPQHHMVLLWSHWQQGLLLQSCRWRIPPSQRRSVTHSAWSEGTDPQPWLSRAGTRLLSPCWKGPGTGLVGKGKKGRNKCINILVQCSALLLFSESFFFPRPQFHGRFIYYPKYFHYDLCIGQCSSKPAAAAPSCFW